MSYEGYVQNICANGHYYEHDAFDEEKKCGCGAVSTWSNDVSETNCDSCGEIPFEVLREHCLLTSEQLSKCNLGYIHVTTEATYRLPTGTETKAWQCVRITDGSSPLVLLADIEQARNDWEFRSARLITSRLTVKHWR